MHASKVARLRGERRQGLWRMQGRCAQSRASVCYKSAAAEIFLHAATCSHTHTLHHLRLAQCPAPGGRRRALQAVVDAISSFGESLASGPGKVPESYTLFGTRPAGRKLLGGRARD